MPCFELWLILHFKDVDNLDLDKIKTNKRISNNKNYVKKLFSDIKGENNFIDYHLKLGDAIKRLKHEKLTQDINKIHLNVGTTVYKLIEDFYKQIIL